MTVAYESTDNTGALNRIDIAERRYHAAARDMDARWTKALAKAKTELQEAKQKSARRASGAQRNGLGSRFLPVPGKGHVGKRSGAVKAVLQTGGHRGQETV